MRASEVIWSLVKDSLEALKKGRRDGTQTPRGLSVANISSHFINQRASLIFLLQLEISIEARGDLLAAAWRLVMLFDRFVADGSSKALNRASS